MYYFSVERCFSINYWGCFQWFSLIVVIVFSTHTLLTSPDPDLRFVASVFLGIILLSGLIYLLRQDQKPKNVGEKSFESLDKKVVTPGNSGVNQKASAKKGIIECPYCLEDIYAGAIKCKHCKSFIKGEHKDQNKIEGEEKANGNGVSAGVKEIKENNYPTKIRPEDEKTMMMGVLVLFVAQNNFFIDISSGDLKYIIDDNVKRYVGNGACIRFINKHKREHETLLDGNQSIAYYAKKFIPSEPEIYPTSVGVAQKQHSHLLLDIVTLELHYYLSLAVAMTMNKAQQDIGNQFFSYYIQCLNLAGWSESGLAKAWELGSQRYDEYALRLSSRPDGGGLHDLGALSSEYIFNTTDYHSISYLAACFTDVIKNFADVFDQID